MSGMTNETNATEEAAAAAKAEREQALRTYLKLVKKSAQEPLAEEELGLFNKVLANPEVGGLDALLGAKFVHIGPHKVQMELEVGPTHLQPWGLANGGVYCCLGETAGSVAGYAAAGARPPVVGVNNNTDFYRSARAGEVIVTTAEPEYLGRTMQLWRIEHVRKSDNKLLARTNLRVAVLSDSK